MTDTEETQISQVAGRNSLSVVAATSFITFWIMAVVLLVEYGVIKAATIAETKFIAAALMILIAATVWYADLEVVRRA